MAEKRMFTKKITESDAFLDMPLSAQCLYFHLNMCADDDGFVNAPKKIQRLIGAKDDDLKILIMKSFLLVFEHGVVVIKHWRMHNTIRQDRYHPTDYQEEFKSLGLKSNGSYSMKLNGNQMATKCIPLGTSDIGLDIDLDKDILNEFKIYNNFDQNLECEDTTKKNIKCCRRSSFNINGKNYCNQHARKLIPELEIKDNVVIKKYGEFQNVKLSDEEFEKLKNRFHDYQKRIENLSYYIKSKGDKYKNHYATILNWARKEDNNLPEWFDKDFKQNEEGLDELEKVLEEFK